MIAGEESFDITLVRDLYAQLQQARRAKQPVIIDAERVERVDTAVLQLLCAFVQDAKASGVTLQWRHPSAPVRQAARLLDLCAHLGFPAD